MALIRHPQVRVIYAECNTPPAGTQSGYLFDTWYDKTSVDITASHVAALAALGLSYNAGTGAFTALAPSVWSVTVALNVDQTPGGVCFVELVQPDYLAGPRLDIANPNTLPYSYIERLFPANINAGFQLISSCANGSDTPISYAALSIVRLV